MNDLSVLIGSCDAYNHMCKNFDILFKRYWKVNTLNYFVGEIIPINEDNYINILPGYKPWGERMLAGLYEIKTKYVCFFLEDYYFTEEISESFILEHIKILEEYNAQKIMFDKLYPPGVYQLDHIKDNLYQFNISSDYLNSIQPAIWDVEYLKKILSPNYSPWDFELEGNNYTKTLNPILLLNARLQSVYFNYSRVGGTLTAGWEELFIKEGLS